MWTGQQSDMVYPTSVLSPYGTRANVPMIRLGCNGPPPAEVNWNKKLTTSGQKYSDLAFLMHQ